MDVMQCSHLNSCCYLDNIYIMKTKAINCNSHVQLPVSLSKWLKKRRAVRTRALFKCRHKLSTEFYRKFWRKNDICARKQSNSWAIQIWKAGCAGLAYWGDEQAAYRLPWSSGDELMRVGVSVRDSLTAFTIPPIGLDTSPTALTLSTLAISSVNIMSV